MEHIVTDRKLPAREQVFVWSLQRHGYRLVRNRRQPVKKRYGYVVPATKREDADGIDFWVKPRGADQFIPIQVTQRGTALFTRYNGDRKSPREIAAFEETAAQRVREKRKHCALQNIAFALIRDFAGERLDTNIAWGDVKALHYAIAHVAPAGAG